MNMWVLFISLSRFVMSTTLKHNTLVTEKPFSNLVFKILL